MTHDVNPADAEQPADNGRPAVELELRPERRLIGVGSLRHIDFQVRVARPEPAATRPPLAISLVLDRSGSMSGAKIETARQAALAVLDRLSETDRVAAVVFDNQVDVLQEGAPAAREVRARLRAEILGVQARGGTALHAGWLAGCRAIAPRVPDAMLTRCFLLTDGQANAGLTDAEQIAIDVARVRAQAVVGTSTFGIGDDYAETLLGPMAVAGGGQFHHLRSADDIARTFLGELGELFNVAAHNVQLEIIAGAGTAAEVISPYWAQRTGNSAWAVALGDLVDGDERHAIIRFEFKHVGLPHGETAVDARVVWRGPDGGQHASARQRVTFQCTDQGARVLEAPDIAVLRCVAAEHAERARRLAITRCRAGDIRGAQQLLQDVARRIARYAGTDIGLHQSLAELHAAERDLVRHGYQSERRKEEYFQSQTRSRGQRDLRPNSR